MNKLQKSIEKTRLRNLKRAKANYKLARDLGFSSSEANILSQRSEKNIRKLAEERKNINLTKCEETQR